MSSIRGARRARHAAGDETARALKLGPPQIKLFHAVAAELRDLRAPWAVGGALAMFRYTGVARPTKDIDIFLPGEWVPRVLDRCAAAGLATARPDPIWLGKIFGGRYFVDLISGMSNGALWVTGDWVRHARRHTALGEQIPMLAPEEMILSKLFVTRRDRFDGADVAHLIYCTPGLDWERLITAAAPHGVGLLPWHLCLFRYVYPQAAGSVPMEVWRRMGLEATAPAADVSSHAAEFRGTLIDRDQFRLDVERWRLRDLEAELRAARIAARRPRAA